MKERQDCSYQLVHHRRVWYRSAVDLGYLDDPFVKYFVKRPSRRPPLINRGSYLFLSLTAAVRGYICLECGKKHGADYSVFTHRIISQDRVAGRHDRTVHQEHYRGTFDRHKCINHEHFYSRRIHGHCLEHTITNSISDQSANRITRMRL